MSAEAFEGIIARLEALGEPTTPATQAAVVMEASNFIEAATTEYASLRELLARFYVAYAQMWGGDQMGVLLEEVEEKFGIDAAARERIENDAPERSFTDAFARIKQLQAKR